MGRNKQWKTCSQSSWWFRQTGSSENIHECGLRSGVNDTSSPAPADLGPSGNRTTLIVQMQNAAARSVTHKSSGKKGSERALTSSENYNQTLRLLSEKLIFAAVARKGFALELHLRETTESLGEVMWNEV